MNIYFRIQTIVQFLAQSVPKEKYVRRYTLFPGFLIKKMYIFLRVGIVERKQGNRSKEDCRVPDARLLQGVKVR